MKTLEEVLEAGTGWDCVKYAYKHDAKDGRLRERVLEIGDAIDCQCLVDLLGDGDGRLAARIKVLREKSENENT